MKSNRYGQSEVLDTNQLDLVIDALPEGPHRVIAQICRRTGCRIGEAIQLQWHCISDSTVLFPAKITKGKLKSRSIPKTSELDLVLKKWRIKWRDLKGREPKPSDWLFPGRGDKGKSKPLSTQAFDLQLRAATYKAKIHGFSSHGFRRSALSSASDAGVPLRHLMELSGHSSLDTLERYLRVNEKQKVEAAKAFA